MDAFVTRKRKKDTEGDLLAAAVADDEPTEVKLAILSSLHPEFPQEALLDVLLAHEGIVSDASESLVAPGSGTSLTSSRPRKPAAPAAVSQTSLRNFAQPDEVEGFNPHKRAKLLSRKGATLHLYDPEDIAEHTPCSIVHNFLPSDLANDLLREMLEEAKTYDKITFKLFDNVVSSPHTSSFYVDSYDEMQRQKFEVGISQTSIPKISGCESFVSKRQYLKDQGAYGCADLVCSLTDTSSPSICTMAPDSMTFAGSRLNSTRLSPWSKKPSILKSANELIRGIRVESS